VSKGIQIFLKEISKQFGKRISRKIFIRKIINKGIN